MTTSTLQPEITARNEESSEIADPIAYSLRAPRKRLILERYAADGGVVVRQGDKLIVSESAFATWTAAQPPGPAEAKKLERWKKKFEQFDYLTSFDELQK